MNATRTTGIAIVALCASLGAGARTFPDGVVGPNYDPEKIGTYTLEDPLVFEDGRKVATAADWAERRREIVALYEREMYGRTPPPPETVVTDLLDDRDVCAGFARMRSFKMWFRKDMTGPKIEWIVFHPKTGKGPFPVILFLNPSGNQALLADKHVPLSRAWLRNSSSNGVVDNHTTEASRATLWDLDRAMRFPLDTIIARGYAVISCCYGEVSPDPDIWEDDKDMATFPYTGIFELWPPRDPKGESEFTALGAWAWTLSRGLDLAERLPEIDAKRSVVTGSSRLGKSALLAGSRDERFAVVVPNQTGNGGVPLAKRNFGENVSTETWQFPHWFCRRYARYANREKEMPFDQHFLLATIAPRALLVQGFNNPWFDTEGEYLACRAASPAWTVNGLPGLPGNAFPETGSFEAVGPRLGYYRRIGGHGIAAIDWLAMMDFADGVFGIRR